MNEQECAAWELHVFLMLRAFAEVLEQTDLPERFETPWRKMLEFRN